MAVLVLRLAPVIQRTRKLWPNPSGKDNHHNNPEITQVLEFSDKDSKEFQEVKTNTRDTNVKAHFQQRNKV